MSVVKVSETITLTRGDANDVWTIEVLKGGSAFDISSYTVTFYAHHDDDPHGTNQIDGASTSFLTDGTDGKVTMTFSAAHTALGTGETDFKGTWKLLLVNGSERKWTKPGVFLIERNEMEVVA